MSKKLVVVVLAAVACVVVLNFKDIIFIVEEAQKCYHFCSGHSHKHAELRILRHLPWRHGVVIEHDHCGDGLIVTTNGGVLNYLKFPDSNDCMLLVKKLALCPMIDT